MGKRKRKLMHMTSHKLLMCLKSSMKNGHKELFKHPNGVKKLKCFKISLKQQVYQN